jgi:mannose-6-phosphate isomerase-like protein (cupin superfamily)
MSTENAEHYVWGDNCDGWYLVRSPELTIIQEQVPPEGKETRHYHERAWQFFFVLGGEAVLEVGGERHVLRAHEGLEVAPQIVHQLRNESGREVRFLVISRPDSHGDRIQVDENLGPRKA